MNAVLHLPVAEQYPSRTATVESLASKRISGISGGLLGAAQVNVWPEVFARNGEIYGAFEGRAVFGGNPCLQPLLNDLVTFQLKD